MRVKDRVLAYKSVSDARGSNQMLSQDNIDLLRDRTMSAVGQSIQGLQDHINRDFAASGHQGQLPSPARYTQLHIDLL
jgi:hypothetical protein